MNGKPNKKQKKFHEWVLSRNCIIFNSPAELHHIGGARMKLKGVEGYAGEWYVLPLCADLHRLSPHAVHQSRLNFQYFTGGTEKEHWVNLMGEYFDEFGQYPMSDEEYQIILTRG